MDEPHYDILQNGSEENENVRSVRKKAVTVNMETVTLIGKGR